jgi:hypothetical protein
VGQVLNLTFTGNDLLRGQYGVISAGRGDGNPTLTSSFPGVVFGGPGALANTFHDPIRHCAEFTANYPKGNTCSDP